MDGWMDQIKKAEHLRVSTLESDFRNFCVSLLRTQAEFPGSGLEIYFQVVGGANGSFHEPTRITSVLFGHGFGSIFLPNKSGCHFNDKSKTLTGES